MGMGLAFTEMTGNQKENLHLAPWAERRTT